MRNARPTIWPLSCDAKLVRDRRGEDESARLHANDDVYLLVADLGQQSVDRRRERVAFLEERGDVLEEDPGLRKVGNIADLAGEMVSLYRHVSQISELSGARS